MPDGEAPTVEAAYPSRCPWCDAPILAGDLISPTDDDEWVHDYCVEEANAA